MDDLGPELERLKYCPSLRQLASVGSFFAVSAVVLTLEARGGASVFVVLAAVIAWAFVGMTLVALTRSVRVTPQVVVHERGIRLPRSILQRGIDTIRLDAVRSLRPETRGGSRLLIIEYGDQAAPGAKKDNERARRAVLVGANLPRPEDFDAVATFLARGLWRS